MKLTLTGYRLHNAKRKDQRTVVAYSGGGEQKFREALRGGEATGEPYKGKLTPQYMRTS